MNFSRRTDWYRRNNRLTDLLDRRRVNGTPIHDLTVSNPTECGFTYPKAEILAALSRPDLLRYAPDPQGILSAREAVSGYYTTRGVEASPSNIILTSGSSEAYSFLLKLLCDEGESVLVPVPSYPLFDYLSQINDVKTSSYSLSYDHGWHVDMRSVREAITPSSRAIVVVSPHNPTGMCLGREEFGELTSLASEHKLALIVDEVFSAYRYEGAPNQLSTPAGANACLTFTINGISKLCGLPQLKLGWIVAGGDDLQVREAMERLAIIGDTFLSVNTPVQCGLREILQLGGPIRDQIMERCSANRRSLLSQLGAGSACSLLEGGGGWNAVLRIPTVKSDEEWALGILEHTGVLTHPGYFFDFAAEGHLVVSLLPEEFGDSIRAMLTYIQGEITSPGHSRLERH